MFARITKSLLAVTAFAFATTIFAASPSYENFNSGDFTRSGNTLKLKPTLTNAISGTTITSGTINSNKLDAATIALFTPYTAPSITSFVNNQNSVEIGSTVTSTTLDWVRTGTITNQSLNQGIGSLATNLLQYVHSSSYTTDRTYTLTITDGRTTNSANTSVTFLSKAYWGVSALTSLNDAQIIALSSEFATSRVRSKSVSPSSQYIYFCYPASFGAASFTVNGFTDTAWTLLTRAFVNASGESVSYNIYRTDDTATGTFTVAIN